VLTLSIRAKHPGRAILSFKDFEIYPDDGTGEKIISESHSAAFDIASTQRATIAKASPVIVATATIAKISDDQTAPTRSMDVNTDGFVNILDVSIMVMRLLMPYDFHFDINSDGSVNVADVTAVLNAVR
jgi:hypothetical protein